MDTDILTFSFAVKLDEQNNVMINGVKHSEEEAISLVKSALTDIPATIDTARTMTLGELQDRELRVRAERLAMENF
jgi:hypothetical protein